MHMYLDSIQTLVIPDHPMATDWTTGGQGDDLEQTYRSFFLQI